ncbi:MAG TPA: hypothetical protein PKE03_09940 [Bacteroidales bacterium]|nr:hypothetical protein [Bacteroidales bacterium]
MREHPTLIASTLPKHHKPTLQPKLCQRACKCHPRKIGFKKFPSLLKKIKNATHNPTINDTYIQQRQWFTDTDERTPAANSGFAKVAVQYFV